MMWDFKHWLKDTTDLLRLLVTAPAVNTCCCWPTDLLVQRPDIT